MKWSRLARYGAALIVAIAVIVEIGLREAGFIDFPIYHVDDDIGYIIRPNQSGAFMRSHTWTFNDRSMGTSAAWMPSKKPNLLLIGNSIVMGGNPYAQPEKIGPLMQALLGDKIAIWPIGVGGWTEVNETVYLERNPDVAKAANFFVWIVLRGGLSQLSPWRGDYVFPRERPLFATWYVLRRYVLPRLIVFDMSELPPQGASIAENRIRFESALSSLSKATGRAVPGILVLYPSESDVAAAMSGTEWLAERVELETVAAKFGLRILDLAKRKEWQGAQYRDGTHPTVEGNRILAQIVAEAVNDSFPH